jgi:DNA repair protein RecN (Recombination protein N)
VLTGLSIRDVVLIEKLDLLFGPGLTVLTGETGAGKSILLDSLGLALGARADAGLVRQGAASAGVSARFMPPADHAVHALLDELGLPREDEIVLRRSVEKTGRSRAWVNDAPVGAAALRQLGMLLVEVQGQHDQMGLADPAAHVKLLDSYGVGADLLAGLVGAYRAWRAAEERLAGARTAIAAARREEDFLRHAVGELDALAPEEGEETALAETRQRLQQGEKRAEAIEAALAELAPRDRRSHPPAAALRATCRVLERLKPSAAEVADPESSVVAPILAAIERAEEAIAEAEGLLTRLAADAEADPRLLEQTEERLFALRAAARKHAVPVSGLAALLADLRERLAALDHGEAEIDAMAASVAKARGLYVTAAERVSAARVTAAARLEKAVAAELPPLRLERARFFAQVEKLPEIDWGPHGADQVRFLISTNPGQNPGALGKVASGGELSRLMLALKVAFSAGGTVPTLVFDEVDSGIGGATAAAVGDRLARVADDVQVLVVTHSPQVAARGAAHFVVSKADRKGRTETAVVALEPAARREEIARMLAGEVVTEAARAAAASLLHAG